MRFWKPKTKCIEAWKGTIWGLVILSAATVCFIRRQRFSQLFYAPPFASKMFSSISFNGLAAVSIKLLYFVISWFQHFTPQKILHSGPTEMFLWQRISDQHERRRWLEQFLSTGSENQTLNCCVPSLTAALLLKLWFQVLIPFLE